MTSRLDQPSMAGTGPGRRDDPRWGPMTSSIQSWASHKSNKAKDGPPTPPAAGRDAEVSFHGEVRSLSGQAGLGVGGRDVGTAVSRSMASGSGDVAPWTKLRAKAVSCSPVLAVLAASMVRTRSWLSLVVVLTLGDQGIKIMTLVSDLMNEATDATRALDDQDLQERWESRLRERLDGRDRELVPRRSDMHRARDRAASGADRARRLQASVSGERWVARTAARPAGPESRPASIRLRRRATGRVSASSVTRASSRAADHLWWTSPVRSGMCPRRPPTNPAASARTVDSSMSEPLNVTPERYRRAQWPPARTS